MDLSNDLISKFVKITNDDKNKNSESTVYGTVVEYNGGMYVRIDGSDLLTPVETTADFKPNERVTVMIKNHSATVTGNITSPATNEGAVTEKVTEAVEEVEGKVITEVEILIADRVSTKQLDAEVARIDELIAGKASVEDLTVTNAEITNLKADKASIKDLTATNAEITNLKAKDAEIENLVAGKATVEDLTATNAEITNLKAKDAEIENLVADKARIEDLTATNARIDSLQANKADITYLDANFATIDELEAAHADIEILDAEVANINTLVNGNLTSDNILSLNITSQNTTMENAFVKDAMIDTVTANKIMSGTIDTNNVTIQSTDGSMLLQGTLLQMKDDNGKVRIQIGKDTGGNFTFILYDESGTGVLIDEEGIKSSDAIADGLIVDAKVADNANIAGSKLNIASVITEVNKDNSTTIKSNKIYLDEQGQSLEVAFNSLKTQVETIQDVTIDGDLTAVIEQVQSNTTQIAANKEGISTLVSENTSRKEEIQNLDGEIESVNSTLSSKYSSLEQDVSGFKTTVADTYTTKSEFNGLQIGGVNLVLWSECIELDSSDHGNNDNSIIENNTVKITPMNDGNVYNYTVYTSETRLQGETYTLSFDILSPDDIGFYWYPSESYSIDDKIKASSKWQTVSFTYTQWGETTANPVLFGFHRLIAGHVYYYRRLKLEKGNKPTAWSPAPEDVQGQIDATNDNLQNNYSTTSAMNSAIQQKANEITSTVSQTYTTKSEFNNLQIGGTNTFKTSKVGSETWDINYNSIITGNSENGFNVSTADGRMHMRLYHTIKDNGYWTVSFKVKSSVYVGPIHIDICDKVADSFNSDTNWSEVTRTVLVDNYSVDPFNFVDIEQHIDCGQAITYYFKDVKVEKGNRPTAWSPAPEDVQGQIDATNNNLSANYSTTSAMNSAIQQKANEITSSVSETYTTKSEFNSLQIGGKNLLLNSKRETSNNVYCIDEFRPTELFEVGEIYTVSICVTPANGVTHIQPYVSGGWANISAPLYVNGATKQVVSMTFTFYGYESSKVPVDIYDNNAFVQFYRFPNDETVTSNTTLHWVKVEKGAKATDWSPAPEDVQGQIDATNNNLATNYSTTSQMDSAIQQKANEITSTVSQTYTTKSETTAVQNQITTSRNLLMGSRDYNLDKWRAEDANILDEWYNGTRIYTTSVAWASMDYWVSDLIDRGVIELFTPYTFSCYVMSTGSDYTPNIRFYGEGLPNFSDASCGTASTSWQRMSITIEWSSLEYIRYPIRFEATTPSPSGSYLKWACLQLERGRVATGWAPAPEDAQYGINEVNNNLVNNYSTTSAMNSAIQQKANEITSTVSQTYTTKSEFNNLQIGGTNLIQNGNFKGAIAGSTSMPNPWTFWGTDIHIYGSHGMPGYDHVGCVYIGCNLTDGRQSGIYSNRIHVSKVEKGANYMASFIFATESNVKGANAYIEYLNDACDQIVNSQVIASARVSTNIGGNGLNEHQYHIPFTMWTGDFSYVQITFNHGGTNVVSAGYLMIVGNVQIEKGNKATAWSPAPEDIQGQIDATNANLQNNYSTTSAMNSAIQQKANEITSSVSQTYATKQSVTDINNNLANNYSTTSQMNSAIQQKANEITSSVSQTYITNYEAKKLADTTTTGLNKYLFERYQRDGFDYSTRPTLNDLVGARLIESQLMDHPPSATSDLGSNYIGVLTFYLYYDHACTKAVPIMTDDHGTVYLNNVAIYELTTCIQADVTFNMVKGLNRIDIIYAEGGGGDGVSWGGVDGWVAFGAYANVVTNEIANRTNELTLAMTQGNMLYTDPTFRNGNNGTAIYNNHGNGTVTNERIAAIEGCPNTSGYCLKITTNGEASPWLGGFAFRTYCRYNAVFITKITAKIPVGYRIGWASNHYGDNGEQKWLSSTEGTGDWYDYYCKVKCGDYGHISDTNYFYLDGPLPTAENPVTWYVSYATVFDVTDSDERITNLTNNLAVNYSTTSQMNSAIQQKANEITSTVSQTYTTKSETTAVQNQITTSRNLLMGSRDYNLGKWGTERATILDEWYNGTRIYTTIQEWASMDYYVSDLIDRGVIELFTPYTFSCYVMSTGSDYTPNIHFYGDGLPNYHGAYCGTATTSWQRISITIEWSSLADRSYGIRFEATTPSPSGSHLRWACFQLERGKVATGWGPAPEDAQYGINEVNNNLANNYSTTSAMNSAIQQKANEITSSVSETYATKQSVTDVNNNLANNYSTTSQMNTAIQQKANEITSSVSQTYTTKSETSLINDTVAGNRKWLFEMYTNNQQVGTGGGTFPTLAHLANETLISSRLVDSLPGYTSAIGDFYIGVYTVYLYYESAYTWNGHIISDDESTTYLNGVAVCQAPSCTQTSFTMNFKKGINKLQIIHGEGGGGDGVTLSDLGPWKEYGAYPACVAAASSNYYASNSDIVQTANDLTIKFTESGGYNLLQNGHADKGTSYWVNNGGGITTNANAGGGATGNFFGTDLPSGIRYYDWVKLLPNTHYVYQAKIWSNATFTGDGYVPLHYWFSYDTVNNTGDGYTILDYQQNVSYTGTWTQCYLHFVTGNNDIYIKPFIYNNQVSTSIFVTELMLSQSRVVQPWSPHPSEVYSGITQVDKDGIRVHHSNANSYTHMSPDGFFVNNNGTDVVQVTASGLYVQGNITSGSTIQGARITGSTFNSSNDVFQVLEDGTIETSFLAVNGAVSTDKLNVNDIENASYPKVLSEATTVYISPNGGVNAEEFYDGAYFTSLSNMLSVAPRNLNGYTLTIRMAGDLYENAALTWFHSGQVNFEMQGHTLYGYFYGYGPSMCYRLYGNTNANNNGTWGHIKPNTGRALGSYSYAVQFQYCQFAVNNIAVYPSASSGSSSGGISAHRGATGIVFSAKACGDMRYLVRAEYAGRVHVNSSEGACNNATFCASTGGIITLNSSNDQAGRTTTGNPYWVGTGGIIAADQLLGMDKIKFNNASQSGSSSSSGSATRKVTETVKATSADTYRSTVYNNWKGDGTVRQGDYGYGDCQGCWFFGNNLYTTMNAGTVTKVVIRIQRQSGGVNALQTLTVKSHNHTSRPSGAPTYTDTIGTCSCAVGSHIDLVITDSTTINKLKNCKGLGLSIGSASSPYAVCSGACSVIITYTTNS